MKPNSYSLECNMSLVTWGTKCGRGEILWLLGWEDILRQSGFLFSLSQITHSGEIQLPCHEDTPVAMWRVCVTSYWGLLTIARWVSYLEAGPLVPVRLSDDCNPNWYFIIISWNTLAIQLNHSQIPNPQKTVFSEVIDVCCYVAAQAVRSGSIYMRPYGKAPSLRKMLC